MGQRLLSQILLLTFLIAPNVRASALSAHAIEVPKKLQVLEGASGPLPTSTFLRFVELGRKFGLSSVFQPAQADVLDFQAALSTEDLSRAILVRIDKKTSQEWDHQVFKHPFGYFTSMKLGSSRATVFFIGFREKEVLTKLSAFQKEYSASLPQFRFHAVTRLCEIPMGRAWAAEAVPAKSTKQAEDTGALAATERYAYAFGESSVKCLQGVNDAFNAATVGPFISTGRGLKVLFNPKKSLKENWLRIWGNTVFEWQMFVDSIRDFETIAKTTYHGFVHMAPSEKSRLYCDFIASTWGGKNLVGKVSSLSKAEVGRVSGSLSDGGVARGVTNSSRKATLTKTKGRLKPTGARGPPPPEEAIANLEKKIGKKLEVHINQNMAMTQFGLVDPVESDNIGYLNAIYREPSRTLKVGYMETMEAYRGSRQGQSLGIGELMMSLALKKFPDTEVISTHSMVQTNREIFMQAVQKGMSREEALKQTPAYKIRAKFGFTEIVPGSIDGELGFAVRKPQH